MAKPGENIEIETKEDVEDEEYYSPDEMSPDTVLGSSNVVNTDPNIPLPGLGKTIADIHEQGGTLGREIGELEKVKTRKQDEEPEDLTNVSVLSEPPLKVNEELLGSEIEIDQKDDAIDKFMEKNEFDLKDENRNALRSDLTLKDGGVYLGENK